MEVILSPFEFVCGLSNLDLDGLEVLSVMSLGENISGLELHVTSSQDIESFHRL